MRLFELTGKAAGEIELPGLGTATGFTGKRKDTETFYSYTSFTEPPTIYRYDFKSGQSSVLFRPKVDFKSDDYTTEQVFYQSKDGTRVPMFIDLQERPREKWRATRRCFTATADSISRSRRRFHRAIAVWMEMGGVYAVANLRGGGEYGEEWHQAGTKLRKAKRVRRFHRRRRMADREQIHFDAEARDQRPQQRRLARRRVPDAAARICGARRCRRSA